ncbi:MAG: adenylate kinase [Luteolibacter sp.]|uniref:adenylate kinase n=1 Tax=Luteolibacter sp. TaxID=1962973 RepID=UPI0032678F43
MPEIIKPDLSGVRRINVVGSSGSGKSTFSNALANILQVRHIEMDALFWGPDWHWPSDEEFFGKLRAAVSKENWVLDGNYNRTIDIKWEEVDMVVWLDPGFPTTFFRSVKRAFKRSLTREEIWEGTGNRESFRKSFFSNDSIILWSVTNFRSIRRKYEALSVEEKYSHIRFVRLKTPSETEAFLKIVREHHKPASDKPALTA